MLLDILTPEKKLYSGDVTYVEMPGIDGYFGVMDHHAAMISALKAGQITVDQVNAISPSEDATDTFIEEAQNKRFSIDVKGGVVEIFHNKVIVLLD
ncbi:MAG: F-type H+-transporting ATPase subunit epsilon [Salibacteraceae bacterium]|jgi:F-type H+-transporting ATPase subunit epsilon